MASPAKKKTTKASRDKARLKELELGEQILTGENRGLRTALESSIRDVQTLNTEITSLRSELEFRDSRLEELDGIVQSLTKRLEMGGIERVQLRKLLSSATRAGAGLIKKFAEAERESDARADDILMLVRFLNKGVVSGESHAEPKALEGDSDLEAALEDLLGAFSSR